MYVVHTIAHMHTVTSRFSPSCLMPFYLCTHTCTSTTLKCMRAHTLTHTNMRTCTYWHEWMHVCMLVCLSVCVVICVCVCACITSCLFFNTSSWRLRTSVWEAIFQDLLCCAQVSYHAVVLYSEQSHADQMFWETLVLNLFCIPAYTCKYFYTCHTSPHAFVRYTFSAKRWCW